MIFRVYLWIVTLTYLCVPRPASCADLNVSNATNAEKVTVVGQGVDIPASREKRAVTFGSDQVRIECDLVGGTADFVFHGSRRISGVYSLVRTDKVITSRDYTNRSYSVSAIHDSFGTGRRVTVVNRADGLPALKQIFYLYDDHEYLLAQVELDSPRSIRSNLMSPLETAGTGVVSLETGSNNRMMWMPYDNDNWYDVLRDESVNGEGTSYEVSAMYDNASRNGFVFGSVTHDFWKTGITFKGSNNKLDMLRVYGGVTSERDTRDLCAHGAREGKSISSPKVFVGWFADWRRGLETYADANTKIVPAKIWKGAKPIGWNSWGAFHTNMMFDDAMAASDYAKSKLQSKNYTGENDKFYFNLDAWSAKVEERMPEFLSKIDSNHQALGMYLAPFSYWGDDMDAKVPHVHSNYKWGELVLKTYDGQHYPRLEGGFRPLDPTHPGTKELLKYYLDRYRAWGVKHVKLDFMNGASCEGLHYDPNAKSGVQAFNQGLKFIMDNSCYPDGTEMFLDLELSPYFPYQYTHAQLVTSDIHHGGLYMSKYALACTTYGWWRTRLVPYNECGIFTLEETDNTPLGDLELGKMRVNSMVVAGSPLIVCIDPKRQDQTALAEKYLTNKAIMSFARINGPFTPVEGATGSEPSDIYIYHHGKDDYLGVFNFTESAVVKSLDLQRAGLDAHATYRMQDLWTGQERQASGKFNIELGKNESTIFKLTRNATIEP